MVTHIDTVVMLAITMLRGHAAEQHTGHTTLIIGKEHIVDSYAEDKQKGSNQPV